MKKAKEICEDCGKVFEAGSYTFLCRECRNKRMRKAKSKKSKTKQEDTK